MSARSYYSFIIKQYVLFFYLIPIALLVWFVAIFSVNVPFMDQWTLVSLFEKIAEGKANIGDFFAQHFEHRMLLLKAIFSTIAFSSRWNVQIEIACSVFLSIISFYAIYKIAATTKQDNDNLLFHIFNISSCVLFFSLVQFSNWLSGFQLQWYLTNASVILAVFILTVPKNLSPYLRLSLAALCCFIASFSSAAGLLSWLAVIPSVFATDAKQRKIRLFLWLLLFVLSCAIYSIGYQKPVYSADLLFFLKKPLVAAAFVLMLVGSSISSVINPAISGFIVTVNFLFLIIYYLKNLRSEFARNATPWLSLGLFSALFILMTTIGRVGYGVGNSLQSRYTTGSVILVIATIQLWRLLIYCERKWVSKDLQIRSIGCFLFGLLTAIFIANSSLAIAQGREAWLEKISGKSCVEVIHYLDKIIDELPDSCLRYLTLDTFKGMVFDSSESLERLGFRTFPKDIAFVTKTARNYGSIELPTTKNQPITLPRNLSVKLSGWATLPDGREQPRIVLLSYGDNKSFFANAIVKLPRPDIGNMLKLGRYSRIGWDRFGWEVNISGTSLPLGETVIKAWVYDRDNKQFVKLNGTPKIIVIPD